MLASAGKVRTYGGDVKGACARRVRLDRCVGEASLPSERVHVQDVHAGRRALASIIQPVPLPAEYHHLPAICTPAQLPQRVHSPDP